MLGLVLFCGTVIGSFLNVVIHRMPAKESVIYPPSHCPVCEHRLVWYELIPVISYLMQRGKCRKCHKKISLLYPFIELITGSLYLLLWMQYGLTINLLQSLIFISILIPIILIDFQHQIIPDKLNLVGAILGGLVLPFSSLSFLSAAVGVLGGGLIMLLITVISRGGMGGGDIKMTAMMGLFLGWKMTLLGLFLSFIIGGLGSLLLIICGLKHRKDFISFGPFLAIGGFTAYVFGNEFLTWYFQRFFY